MRKKYIQNLLCSFTVYHACVYHKCYICYVYISYMHSEYNNKRHIRDLTDARTRHHTHTHKYTFILYFAKRKIHMRMYGYVCTRYKWREINWKFICTSQANVYTRVAFVNILKHLTQNLQALVEKFSTSTIYIVQRCCCAIRRVVVVASLSRLAYNLSIDGDNNRLTHTQIDSFKFTL